MDEAYLITLSQNAITLMLVIAGPILLISLLIGTIISLIQAATQVNEVTMTFIPKLVGIGLILLLLGSWMMQQLLVFTAGIFNSLPNFVR
ncbi:MAG: EscS/YscS/HrcS family type III secretion system export apparatus protein [Chloroflexi bacterium HGW-Chloroflexi-5]|jgi:flagellar biosynthetic protein FliQ|nr:MAG: EscS/YscS/HrcS family type III secretion system export apparatus protein [Chloroflexi bacterium HGW-Chloroflexi-5]